MYAKLSFICKNNKSLTMSKSGFSDLSFSFCISFSIDSLIANLQAQNKKHQHMPKINVCKHYQKRVINKCTVLQNKASQTKLCTTALIIFPILLVKRSHPLTDFCQICTTEAMGNLGNIIQVYILFKKCKVSTCEIVNLHKTLKFQKFHK